MHEGGPAMAFVRASRRCNSKVFAFRHLLAVAAAGIRTGGEVETGEEYGIFQAHRMADVVRIRGGSVEHRHVRYEDNDPLACCEHDVQRAFHHLRIFWGNISDACIEPDSSSAQHRTAATNEKTDSGRRSRRLVRRNID